MFKKAKFICSYAGCGKSYPFEKIYHHEMFECIHRSILCLAQGCKFINKMETLILHFINCPFHLLYYVVCQSLYNMSVLTHDCNVIKTQCSICLCLNIIMRIRQLITFIKNVFLRNHSYTEPFEERRKINYNMFMSVALSNPPPTNVLTRQILQRQNAVEDFSFPTTHNNTD